MSSQLHAHLRESTTSIHRLLESTSILSGYISTDLSVREFQLLLEQKWIGYAYWQKELDAAFSEFSLQPEWQIWLAPELLQQDCEQFRSPTIESKFRCNDIPPSLLVNNEAGYLGCAYVFEGSKLGSRVILNKLNANPKIRNTGALRFFQQMALNNFTENTWPSWIRRIDEYATKHQLESQDIAKGAVHCFEVLQEWFKQQRIITVSAGQNQADQSDEKYFYSELAKAVSE